MSVGSDDKKRRPLPRWRYAALATMSREHSGNGVARQVGGIDRHELDAAAEAFRNEPTPESAIELLNVSVHYKDRQHLDRASGYLRTLDSRLPGSLNDIISLAQGRNDAPCLADTSLAPSPTASDKERIRSCRHRLRHEPRNIILMLDLARAYTVLGKPAAAERLVRTALAIAPNHRLVLRRAARWLVHVDRPDEAWNLVRTNARTARDPWLMATEISLAEILERPSGNVRSARAVLADAAFGPGVLICTQY